MDLQLEGKTAIVTGGSKGIGLATVRLLLDEGVRVVSGSRTITPELKETGAVPVTADLRTAEGATELVERATAELGGIDILVNNVGVGDIEDFPSGGFLDTADEAWSGSFDLHLYSAVRVSRAALPSLIERKGAIVNVSSINARIGGSMPAYGTSKAALNYLTKHLSAEFGPQGVRTNTVSPGPVSTRVWTDPDGFMGRAARAAGISLDAFVANAIESFGTSTGSISSPEEVARLIAFLASPVNITGQEYVIDGGIVKQV